MAHAASPFRQTMKTLHDLNVEAALAAPAPLARERAITAAFRAHEHDSPVTRELAVLSSQFPSSFEPIEDGDLIAGRIRYPLVSFAPEPGGLGSACLAGQIRSVVTERALDEAARAEAEELIAFWEARTTESKTRAARSEEHTSELQSPCNLV